MGKSSGGSDAPNVIGAAKETGKQARALNREQTAANRPNQYNAWGSTEWSQGPQGKWTQTETLNPELQKQLDMQFQQGTQRSQLGSSMFGGVQGDLSTPMDFSQYGDIEGFDPTQQRQMAEDNAYQKSANRLDPRFAQEQQSMESSLRARGLQSGDQAYDSAMSNFSMGKNDAYEQARLGATASGRDEFGVAMQGNQLANALRSQGINEGVDQRYFGLNEMERLMAGQQIKGGPPSSGGATETIGTKTIGGGAQ